MARRIIPNTNHDGIETVDRVAFLPGANRFKANGLARCVSYASTRPEVVWIAVETWQGATVFYSREGKYLGVNAPPSRAV